MLTFSLVARSKKGDFRKPWFALKPKFRCLKHSSGVRHASTRFAGNGKQGCNVQPHVHDDQRQGRRRHALTPGQATARRTNESWVTSVATPRLARPEFPPWDKRHRRTPASGRTSRVWRGRGWTALTKRHLPRPNLHTNLQQEKGVCINAGF